MNDPANKVITEIRDAEFAGFAFEQVLAVAPERNMGVTAGAGEIEKWLRHEGCAQAVFLCHGFRHILEEGVAIGGDQRVIIFPVHLELTVRGLMVAWGRLPPPRERR